MRINPTKIIARCPSLWMTDIGSTDTVIVEVGTGQLGTESAQDHRTTEFS